MNKVIKKFFDTKYVKWEDYTKIEKLSVAIAFVSVIAVFVLFIKYLVLYQLNVTDKELLLIVGLCLISVAYWYIAQVQALHRHIKAHCKE